MWSERVETGERRADPDREERAHEVLALAADVEHAAAEGERDGEPVRISGVVIEQRLLEVERRVTRSSPVTHGKSQLSPAPSKIAL